ncbi:MAG: hypothetical protein ACF8XB_10690 [Planctomycetota bacterium JB042]
MDELEDLRRRIESLEARVGAHATNFRVAVVIFALWWLGRWIRACAAA